MATNSFVDDELKGEQVSENEFNEIEVKPEEMDDNQSVAESIVPTVWLLRGEIQYKLTNQFTPQDLMTICVFPTGSSRQTHVKMVDSLDQNRYYGRAGGRKQEFVTRLQNTRCFGTWKLEISYSEFTTGEFKEMEVTFEVKEELTEEIDIEINRIETNSGYILQFHDQKPEMFAIVDPAIFDLFGEDQAEIAELTEIDTLVDETELIEELVTSDILEMHNSDLPELKISVTEISGIGPATRDKLAVHDINYVHEMYPFTADELSDLTGISDKKCEKWISQANDIANDPENEIYLSHKKIPEEEIKPEKVEFNLINTALPELKIPVTEIKGIGPSTKKKLNAEGIEYVHDLINYNPNYLSASTSLNEKKCAKWIDQAREIGSDPENDIYKEYIMTISDDVEIPVDEVSGIGPATKKKLHAIGITSVKQLSESDAEVISELSGLSTSRCETWISRAKALL